MSNDERQIGTMVLATLDMGHTPNSKQIVADCGHECWVAVTGQRFLAENPEVKSTCIACTGMTPMDIILTGTMGDNRAMPGQRAELAKLYGQEEADRLFKLLNLEEL